MAADSKAATTEHAQNDDSLYGTAETNRGGNSPPTGYRPGRLTGLQILERVFPLQPRSVLELVLRGCNGDVATAIEQFLSAQDAVVVRHQVALAQAYVRDGRDVGAGVPFSSFAGMMTRSYGNAGDGAKSAFTPLHSAFTARSAAFSVSSLLGNTPTTYPKPAHNNPSPSHYPFPTFSHYMPTTVAGGGYASPMFVTSYRPYNVVPTSVGSSMGDSTSRSTSPMELVCSSTRDKTPPIRD